MHPNQYQNMPDENKQKKNMESNTGKVIFEEDKQKIKQCMKEYLKECRKHQSNNVLKKIKKMMR